MSQEEPTPTNGETITPQQAWKKLCGMFLIAAKDQLKHSVICPKRETKLEFQTNKRNVTKYRICCANCGAQAHIPAEPVWAEAWEEIASKPKLHLLG